VRYVQLSLPAGEAEEFVKQNDYWAADGLAPEIHKMVERLRAALKGKDLRVKNRYPKVKRPRVELDLRKKAS
jgi:hypothetical protein